jgi:flagellar biosynthesis protein FlhG
LIAKQDVPGRGRILAIASGKGGVGKTWFAISLAHRLSTAQAPALLFDADLGLANVDIQLGLTPEHDLGAVLAGRSTFEGACIRHESGFDILTGRSGSGDLAGMDRVTQDRVQQLLLRAASRYANVIVDLGAGLDPFVRDVAAGADTVLVVATDEPTSLTDAYAVLKLHQRDTAPRPPSSQIVINQATSRASGTKTYAALARACQSFLGYTPPLAGIIRRDEKVRDAIRRQTLLAIRHPGSPACEDLNDLAKGLSRSVTAPYGHA